MTAQAELQTVLESLKVQQTSIQEELKDNFEKGSADVEAHKTGLLATVDESMRIQLESSRYATQVAENIFTRSITWRLRGFSHRLAGMLASDGCLRSPGFFLCSLPEMFLEINMPGKVETDTLPPNPTPFLPLPGSCSIRLWAAPGLRLVFRLTLGEGSHAIARRFEHSFQPEESSDAKSHVSFQVK